MRELNLKYVELLKKTYEKYKDVDYLSLSKKAPEDEEPRGQLIIFDNLEEKIKKSNKRKQTIEKPKTSDEVKRRRGKIVLKKPQQFLQHEDDIILQAIKKSDDGKVSATELSKILNRRYASVEARIKKLLLTGDPKLRPKKFSFEEDKMIIDLVLDKLKKHNKPLEEVVKFPTDIIGLAPILKRTHQSIYERWRIVLLNTILSYYRKTLNLDVKSMLIRFVSDNFESQTSIDWDLVLEQPEFVGKTDSHIKKTYYGLLYKTSKELNINKNDVSLQQLAKHVLNQELSKPLSEKRRRRQLDMIQYFEKQCSLRGLKNISL